MVAKDRVERDEEDLVRLYLTDIGQYQLLTKDDEVELAQAIEAAPEGRVPIAVVRDDRAEATVTLLLDDFLDLVREWWELRTR